MRSGPLAVRSFRLLTGGQFASTIGDFCYAVALPWLVLSGHGGAVLLGTVLACYGVPRTVLIPVGGVLADKVGPRTLMLASDTVRCVLVTGLAVLAARHTVSLPALGPIAAVIGAGEGLFIPASFAIMPSLLDGEQLTAGNAVSSAAVQAGSLLGPALGATLVAVTGSSTAALRGRRRLLRRVGADVAADPPANRWGGRSSWPGRLGGFRVGGDDDRGQRRGAGAAAPVAGPAGDPGGGDRGQPGQRRHGRGGAAVAGARQVRGGRLRRLAGLPGGRRGTGLLVHRLGPALFFPVAGGLVAVAILSGLTQREFRDFGRRPADQVR